MTIQTQWFPTRIPAKPSGHYAHFVVLRVTDSYALFQTDGELNVARVPAGIKDRDMLTRLTLFKRKQTTPERLTGREWLRRYDILSPDIPEEKVKVEADEKGRLFCDYNTSFCKQCPDCITYGFAIGDAGSEKSKVLSDTGYSLTAYDDSHEAFTLNAPYEEGTMSRKGEVTSRINEADHVRPQVIFPTVVTTRDLTLPLFNYVFSNILRTRRYGAQTTRTGSLTNRIVAIALTDGEIFSNLKFTQTLYDALSAKRAILSPDPVDSELAAVEARTLIPELLKEDGVSVMQLITGDELAGLIQQFNRQLEDASQAKALLQQAFSDSQAYYQAYIKKS